MRRTARVATACLVAMCALGLSAGGAMAANKTFCVQVGLGGTPYPGCVGTMETSLSQALSDADVEAGTETLYLGPGTYSASSGFVDNSGSHPISIIGDGEGNTTISATSPGSDVLNFDDTSEDTDASVSDLTVDMPDGPGTDGFNGGQNFMEVAIDGDPTGTHSATGLRMENGPATLNDVTITMPLATGGDEGLYDPNGQVTGNDVTITAPIGMDGFGEPASFTDTRIFANESGIDMGFYGSSTLTESEIVMSGASTALEFDQETASAGTLNASFDTIVGDGTAGSVGAKSWAANSGETAALTLTDSVVQDFATSLDCASGSGAATISVSYSDFNPASEGDACGTPITTGAGDINANPDLVTQGNGDETLAFDSPAIDAGDPTITGPLTDLDGNARPVNTGAGSRVDMGAFQYQQWRGPTALAGASPSSVPAGTPATFSAAGSSDPDSLGLTYSWSFDDGGSATGASVQHAFSQVGTHTATLTVTNSMGLVATATTHVTVTTAVATATVGSPSVSGTSVSDDVACTGDGGATCAVTFSLDVTETLKGGKVIGVTAKANGKPKKTRRTVVVGTASVSLDAGQSQTVAVHLNSTGDKLLRSHHKLAAKLTATSGTSVLATQTVTFKEPKKKKKR